MVYFSVILFIPLISLGFIGPVLYARSITRETTVHMTTMVAQVNENIEQRIREMESLIDLVASTRDVASFLGKGKARPEESDRIRMTLSEVSAVHGEIAGILIVAADDAWFGEGFVRTTRDPFTGAQWYSEACAYPGKIRLIARPIGRNLRSTRLLGADEVVSIVKSIIDPRDDRVVGAVLIDLKLAAIEELFIGSPLRKGGFLFIADSTGEKVYAPQNRIVYRIPLNELDDKSPTAVFRIDSADYQVIAQRSRYTGWRTLAVFSLAETLKDVLMIRSLTLIIGGITMLLAIIAAIFFTSSVAKPVLDLRSLMKRVEDGDLSTRFSGAQGDEIGELGRGFNEMIERIQSLIDQVYVEQRSKREAELRILQEQIKPHFLYNTLDTIQWMAQENRVEEVVTIVGALTSLFRIGLNRGKEFVTLSEELEHIESYLCIQKMRYEDKFDYSISCEEPLRPLKVLGVMLQPLVENAIYHGIKERRGHGTLAVEVRGCDGYLLLVVRDDGVGMSREMVASLNAALEDGGPIVGGYGVRNVHERIRLTFGKPYGLSFKSTLGVGTEVAIRHPIVGPEE